MFLEFFYLLRANGLKVSLNEWLTLMEGLGKGLHNSTLYGFYILCRSVILGSQSDFDKFDQVFGEFFGERMPGDGQVPDEMLQWLEHPELTEAQLLRLSRITDLSEAEIEDIFKKRLREQKEEHNGGRKWIGTGGYTAFGNAGERMGGIRVGGSSFSRSAYRLARERRYRDWRSDSTLDSRQLQMAFRSLRQLTRSADLPRTEIDIDATVSATCRQAGRLKIVRAHPRKNALKLLLLIDSGGSMEAYQKLCSQLFQSVNKAGNFKDLRIYYFHNCIGKMLFSDPMLSFEHSVSTEWVLDNYSSDYRVIIVGDAEMSLDELLSGAKWYSAVSRKYSGLDRFLSFKERYPHIIWLHPQKRPTEENYWTRTFKLLSEHFDMYQLSLSGLEEGMKRLMVKR